MFWDYDEGNIRFSNMSSGAHGFFMLLEHRITCLTRLWFCAGFQGRNDVASALGAVVDTLKHSAVTFVSVDAGCCVLLRAVLLQLMVATLYCSCVLPFFFIKEIYWVYSLVQRILCSSWVMKQKLEGWVLLYLRCV